MIMGNLGSKRENAPDYPNVRLFLYTIVDDYICQMSYGEREVFFDEYTPQGGLVNYRCIGRAVRDSE